MEVCFSINSFSSLPFLEGGKNFFFNVTPTEAGVTDFWVLCSLGLPMVSKQQSGTRGYESGGYVWWTVLAGGGVGWGGGGEPNTLVVLGICTNLSP